MNSAEQDTRRPFDRVWHLVDSTSRENQATLDRMYRAYEAGIEHYHKMLVLTAGVIAFVPPLLTQSRFDVNTWFLRRGVISLFATIVLAIVFQIVARYGFMVLYASVTTLHKREHYLIGAAAGDTSDASLAEMETAISSAFTAAASDRDAMLGRWKNIWYLMPLCDLLFYGSFLFGVWNLFRAAYLGN